MTRMGLILGLAVMLGELVALQAEEAGIPAAVRLELQMVHMEISEARSLIPAFNDPQTASQAFAQVQQLIAQDKAELVGWPVIWLRGGTPANEANRSVSETNLEVRYPTERSPVYPPGGWGPGGKPRYVQIPWGIVLPEQMETQNTGCKLEAEAIVAANGAIIVCNLMPQAVRLVGFKQFPVQVSPSGIQGAISRAEFGTASASTQLHLVPNRPTLVASVFASEQEPRATLFIARARAVFPPTSKSSEK